MEASHASSPSEQLFQFWSVSFCTCLWRGIEMLIRFGEWGGYFNIALKNSRNEVPTPDMVFCAGVLQDSGNSRAFMAEAWPLKLHNEWVVFSSQFDQSVDYFSYLFDRSLWVNEIGRGGRNWHLVCKILGSAVDIVAVIRAPNAQALH